MLDINPFLLCDFYKVGHSLMLPKNTEYFYSHMIPRSNKYSKTNSDKVVVAGIQMMIKKWLIDYFNDYFFNLPKEKALAPFNRMITYTIGANQVKFDEVEAIYDYGKLPIVIKAIPEGERVNIKVPVMTIQTSEEGRKHGFAWVTQYLETLFLSELWSTITNATDAYAFRVLYNTYASKTSDIEDFTMWQGHDFSMRGMTSNESAMKTDFAHLLSFSGTDTISGIYVAEKYYNADIEKELVGTSVFATEHGNVTANISNIVMELEENGFYKEFSLADAMKDLPNEDIKLVAEYILLQDLLKNVFPTGILSYVADTNDYWGVLTKVLPLLKDLILNRGDDAFGNSRLTIRPDSSPKYSSPFHMICGFKVDLFENVSASSECVLYEGKYYIPEATNENRLGFKLGVEIPLHEVKGSIQVQYDIFGGDVNSKGYIQLERHIGLIYGDSITYDVANKVMERLQENGFASTNWIAGLGAYWYQNATRDSYGFAIKGAKAIVDGVELSLKKNPKTDVGKTSPMGWCRVEKEGNDYVLYENQTREQEQSGALQVVFDEGKLCNETSFTEIRNRLWA